MKDYIELNHTLRCESTDKNDKSMFKLLNKSLTGRALLNKEKYNSNIRKISNGQIAKKQRLKTHVKSMILLTKIVVSLI